MTAPCVQHIIAAYHGGQTVIIIVENPEAGPDRLQGLAGIWITGTICCSKKTLHLPSRLFAWLYIFAAVQHHSLLMKSINLHNLIFVSFLFHFGITPTYILMVYYKSFLLLQKKKKKQLLFVLFLFFLNYQNKKWQLYLVYICVCFNKGGFFSFSIQQRVGVYTHTGGIYIYTISKKSLEGGQVGGGVGLRPIKSLRSPSCHLLSSSSSLVDVQLRPGVAG